jgi:hypothetical protein
LAKDAPNEHEEVDEARGCTLATQDISNATPSNWALHKKRRCDLDPLLDYIIKCITCPMENGPFEPGVYSIMFPELATRF